jgi:hypothetical protein
VSELPVEGGASANIGRGVAGGESALKLRYHNLRTLSPSGIPDLCGVGATFASPPRPARRTGALAVSIRPASIQAGLMDESAATFSFPG